MTHGQDLVEELPDGKAHSKCLRTALSEEAERQAEKSPLAAKRGEGS